MWTAVPFAVHVYEFLEDRLFQKKELEEELKQHDLSASRIADITDVLKAFDELLKEDDVKEAVELSEDPMMAALDLADELDLDVNLDMTDEEAIAFVRKHRGS